MKVYNKKNINILLFYINKYFRLYIKYLLIITGNMPPQKMKKFCKISKYLEMYDKELYQVFDDLCLFPLLRVRNRGVTLLRPTDKVFRKRLIDATYSQSPETAVGIIKTLILLDFLPDINSYKSREIPNASKFKLEVDKVEGKKFTLKSGHVGEINSKFAPLMSGDLASVWDLSGKDELPLSGTPVVMDNRDRQVAGGMGITSRKALGEFVENTYQKGGEDKNVYKATMSCLYKHATNTENVQLCKQLVDAMCATARASFYVIVEPHTHTPQYIVFDDLINKTMLAKESYPKCIDIFSKSYEKSRNDLIRKVYSEREERNVKVAANDVIRKKLLTNINHITLRSDIQKEYNNDIKFAKDAFTMYCFLSTCNEAGDPKYYNECFLYVVRNIYTTPNVIISSSNTDVAYILSIFLNLLKSDVFKYVPFLVNNGENESRVGYLSKIIDPTDIKSVFTVEQNDITFTQGGSPHSNESLEEFINS
jgi:hypothetical protein